MQAPITKNANNYYFKISFSFIKQAEIIIYNFFPLKKQITTTKDKLEL